MREGETITLQRARFSHNLLTCDRVRIQVEEIIGADEAHFNIDDRLTEAKRVQRRILRTQFGLR